MSHLKDFEHLKIRLEDIKAATNNFATENIIGYGGFGKVYKGEIVHFKGKSTVAFKRLDRSFGQGNPEFWKEIMMLSLYRHENIVSLLGFCDESNEKILVYEYMSKRSLDLYLTNDNLTWVQRLEICIGAARGLAYLHSSFSTHTRVLHRDIKSSNILLDEHWNAKISDVGLSKFGPADQQFTFLFSNAVGTIGYCDPLYVETGFLTKESDVYSFGVVLFEVLCGRLCIGNESDKRRPLTGLAREFYEHNKMSELVFCNIKDEVHPKSLQAYSTIAYRCLKKKREERPLMSEVVRILETALNYQIKVESLEHSDIVDSFDHLEVCNLNEDSSNFFNLIYFERKIKAGEWDESERYLNQFTKLEDNCQSLKMFFDIRKQKYVEALDRNDRAKAVDILVKDLKVFSTYDEDLYNELTQLITLENIRKKELSTYGKIFIDRHTLLRVLIKLIEENPLIVLRPRHDVEEMDSEEETDYEDNDDAEEMDSEEETDYEDNDDAEETSDEEEIDHNSKEPDSEEDQTDELDLVGEASSLTTADIVNSSHLKALRLPDPMATTKVMRIIYTNSGLALLALTSSAVHKLWKWKRTSGKSTASVVPQLWQPSNGALMSNDVDESKPAQESAACIVLSKNDSYVMSASGGKVSLFNIMTFKVMTTFMRPPPAVTYLALHPQDNNIIAIGMEDSSIHIYNVRFDEVKSKLINGHQKQITGLDFSQTVSSLVSAGADAQLCIWNTNGWEKRKSRTIQSPPGYPSSLAGETKVQFHIDQRHLLVVHESQIAIYDYQLECLKLWSPRESLSAGISSAIYSCNGLLLFTAFLDGAVGVFDAQNLRLRCRIAPSVYIFYSSNSTAYPTVIAAHPSDPNQFALGMSDGSVHVIEPIDADLKWGGLGAQDNSTLASSNPSNSALNSQPSETPSR